VAVHAQDPLRVCTVCRAAVQPGGGSGVRALRSSSAWRKSIAEMRSGHSGGSTTTLARSAYSATSAISRRCTSRVSAWTATASGRAGGAGSAQA
jgi:hypothetical protein